MLIDGTSDLSSLLWHPRPGRGKCEHSTFSATVPKGTEVYQLFLEGQMQTPARWPNALWSDKSLLEWKRWASFDNSKPWGPSKYKKGQPITFYDSGPLSESGLDVTGAMMIGNIAHMDTFVGIVTQHAANSSSFDAKYEVDAMGNTKSSNSIYFLEGLASFVDEPSEFAYDPPSGELVLCAAVARCCASLACASGSRAMAMRWMLATATVMCLMATKPT